MVLFYLTRPTGNDFLLKGGLSSIFYMYSLLISYQTLGLIIVYPHAEHPLAPITDMLNTLLTSLLCQICAIPINLCWTGPRRYRTTAGSIPTENAGQVVRGRITSYVTPASQNPAVSICMGRRVDSPLFGVSPAEQGPLMGRGGGAYFPKCHLSNLRKGCCPCHYTFYPPLTCQ